MDSVGKEGEQAGIGTHQEKLLRGPEKCLCAEVYTAPTLPQSQMMRNRLD